jgi:hypothetical protein
MTFWGIKLLLASLLTMVGVLSTGPAANASPADGTQGPSLLEKKQSSGANRAQPGPGDGTLCWRGIDAPLYLASDVIRKLGCGQVSCSLTKQQGGT